MNNLTGPYGYTGSEQFRPLSPWAYFGYTILFAIPVIGWIFLIVFTFSDRNINRRSFARSYWCIALVTVALFAIAGGFGLISVLLGMDSDPVRLALDAYLDGVSSLN